jgi:hypothetical protein
VNAVTGLARQLQMSTVAEGVETLDHANSAIVAGCDEVQGYFFSKPVVERLRSLTWRRRTNLTALSDALLTRSRRVPMHPNQSRLWPEPVRPRVDRRYRFAPPVGYRCQVWQAWSFSEVHEVYDSRTLFMIYIVAGRWPTLARTAA